MNKAINIYAIGSALIDTEIRVTPEFLVANDIEKGVMTLVDEARQESLISAIINHHSHIERAGGGSACNSAYAAAQFGAKVAFSGRVANDGDGELFAKELSNAGIKFHDVRATNDITGKCLVMVTPDADRTMNTFLGASIKHSLAEVDLEMLAASEWLYLEGYLLTDEPRTAMVLKVVEHARAHGVNVALSLSDPFVVAIFGEAIRKVIGAGVDLIFCNADEAKAFTETASIDNAATALLKYCQGFAITDGAHGAIVGDRQTVIRVAGFPTDAVDTNGAGDMFAGAFLAVLVDSGDKVAAAQFANRCAAQVVAKYGPRLSKLAHQSLLEHKPN